MGVVLYWVHDLSPGAARGHELVDRAVPLVVKLIGRSRLPGRRGVVDEVLSLVRTLAPGGAPPGPAAGSGPADSPITR